MAFWETQRRLPDQSEEDYLSEGHRSRQALIANYVTRAQTIRNRAEIAGRELTPQEHNDPMYNDPEGWVRSNPQEAADRMRFNREQELVMEADRRTPVAEHIDGSEYWRESLD